MKWILGAAWPNVQSGQYGPNSALREWAGNWAPVIIKAQTQPPTL